MKACAESTKLLLANSKSKVNGDSGPAETLYKVYDHMLSQLVEHSGDGENAARLRKTFNDAYKGVKEAAIKADAGDAFNAYAEDPPTLASVRALTSVLQKTSKNIDLDAAQRMVVGRCLEKSLLVLVGNVPTHMVEYDELFSLVKMLKDIASTEQQKLAGPCVQLLAALRDALKAYETLKLRDPTAVAQNQPNVQEALSDFNRTVVKLKASKRTTFGKLTPTGLNVFDAVQDKMKELDVELAKRVDFIMEAKRKAIVLQVEKVQNGIISDAVLENAVTTMDGGACDEDLVQFAENNLKDFKDSDRVPCVEAMLEECPEHPFGFIQ